MFTNTLNIPYYSVLNDIGNLARNNIIHRLLHTETRDLTLALEERQHKKSQCKGL